jgi:hypothetical protein
LLPLWVVTNLLEQHLRSVANRMGLPDSTVFNGDTQDAMFLFLARDVISGKRQASKRDALRGTWAGLKGASDAELDIMINEIESGNPSLGAPPIPTITQTTLPAINEAPATATPVAAPTPIITPAITEPTTTTEPSPTNSDEFITLDAIIDREANTWAAGFKVNRPGYEKKGSTADREALSIVLEKVVAAGTNVYNTKVFEFAEDALKEVESGKIGDGAVVYLTDINQVYKVVKPVEGSYYLKPPIKLTMSDGSTEYSFKELDKVE